MMHHLIWCLVNVLLSLGASLLIRSLVYRLSQSTTLRELYDEFAGNFVCAVALMELFILTFAEHSSNLYLVCMYLVLFVRNIYFTYLKLYETPLIFIDLYYDRGRQHEFSTSEIFYIIIVQSIACIVGQSFTKLLWSFQDAVHKNAAGEACLATLSHSHLWYECFALEMLGTFLCTTFDFLMPVRVKPISRPLVLCIAINYFGHVTGAWMNPMLATAFTFRCHGHESDVLHILVFWIAPFVGFSLAWELRMFVRKLIGTFTPKNKEE